MSKTEPVRFINCDLCGKEARMNVNYQYGWQFRNPKGWPTIDTSTFFKESYKDFCPACMKTLKAVKK